MDGDEVGSANEAMDTAHVAIHLKVTSGVPLPVVPTYS